MRLVALVAYVACMASFSWAMQRFFTKQSAARSPGQQLVVYLGGAFALAQAGCLATPPMGSWLSMAFCLWALSLILFWAAVAANRARPLTWAFEPNQPDHLVSTGPYRWIRHPFYLSYTLCWLGPPIATGKPWLLIPVFVMLLLYWRAASAEEANFLSSPLAPAYREYQSRTGRFLPAPF